MLRLRSFGAIAALLLSLYLDKALASVLQEIRSPAGIWDGAQLGKRTDLSSMDLQSSEIFLWADAGKLFPPKPAQIMALSTSGCIGGHNWTAYRPGTQFG